MFVKSCTNVYSENIERRLTNPYTKRTKEVTLKTKQPQIPVFWKVAQCGKRILLVGAFIREKSTIVMAFRPCFFFDTPEVFKIVLPKFYKILRCQIVHFGPGNSTMINIQNWTRLKGPLFSLFWHCKFFFKITKGVRFIFLMVYDKMDRKSLKGSPWCANSVQLLGFSGTVKENTLTP